MHISVVIPTCNRKARLLSLLRCLDQSTHPIAEVIIVDAGEDRLQPADYATFTKLAIQYLIAEPSVCIQRNTGIRTATSSWIFLCDDDIEIAPDYLQRLADHIRTYHAGAVSGVWLEKEKEEWKATHPIHSKRALWWKYIFQLGIWGEIKCPGNDFFTRRIKGYYEKKGNHISEAGWPVNTQFASDYAVCPVYSLGASLVKKEWLLQSPYDEVLDRYGIGDNYGVAVDFPVPGIHIVMGAPVYHHKEPANRLKRSIQYYRRVLALAYFAKTKPALKHVQTYRILWSLTGNLLDFLLARDGRMSKAAFKAIFTILFNRNPYVIAKKQNKKTVEPVP